MRNRKVNSGGIWFLTTAVLIVGMLVPVVVLAGDTGVPADGKSVRLLDSPIQVLLNGRQSYQVTIDGKTHELPQRNQIKLRYRTFDPLTDAPERFIADHLRAQHLNTQEKEAYIVQFFTQAFEAYQEKLKTLGVEIYFPQHDQALIVHMDGETRKAVEKLSFVRWVDFYHPAYKLDEALQNAAAQKSAAARRYNVMLMQNNAAMKQALASFVNSIGGTVDVVLQSSIMNLTLTGEQLRQVAARKEVLSIDLWGEAEDDMDQVRNDMGANYLETVAGYTGQGVRAEVMDRGLLVNHTEFQANRPLIHGDANSGDPGHGTSTYGIVFASGARAKARGLLPNAGQPIFASRYRSGTGSGYVDRYRHTGELVDPGGPYRAVFQTNSWGNARTREYTTISAEMDEILFKNDILKLQSQSNAGNQDSRPEAWSKNVVSVGGIVGYDTPNRSDDRWGGRASIGPASDGRIKPDLSNYYGNIHTTSETGSNSYKEFGGTSGATPATAGYFGLMYQMWADGVFAGNPGQNRDVFASRPRASTAKALMIHSAYQYNFQGRNHDLTRVHQGWGFPDVKNLYDMAKDGGWRMPILINESRVLRPLETHDYTLQASGRKPLKATMVYTDPPGNPSARVHRVNDLTLKVTAPDGTVYWGNNGLQEGNWSRAGGSENTLDNVENVFVQNPRAGQWRIQVIGREIVRDAHGETRNIDADYALVVSGGTGSLTAITDPGKRLPDVFTLGRNYPNPFNPETHITYQLKTTGKVQVQIYDLQGRLVRTLVDGAQAAGEYSIIWDARNDLGQRAASGVYLYRLKVLVGKDVFSQVKKMILLK